MKGATEGGTMPRAKKPAPPLESYSGGDTSHVLITSQDREALIRIMGQKRDSDLAQKMLDDIEHVLVEHQRRQTININKPTASGMLKALNPLKKNLDDFLSGWHKCDPFTLEYVVDRCFFPELKMSVLWDMQSKLQIAIDELRYKKAGKKSSKYVLQMTVNELAKIYLIYRTNASDNFRVFISEALNSRGISHADFSEHPHRFDELISTRILKYLTAINGT
ncbi:MAG: hypothetical protein HY356_05715 [Gammaproteobacteria bacterium]|nr:hypothetical protein [Gammaproteobacteria bacterium]